ncbi:hypothetical protein QE152_g32679 [Popillia japonica]|uniref:Uncharacterized protein n=1 Tax=Popillia japonica TaxID=7064 RepID=A0AAW1IYL9_POPJA
MGMGCLLCNALLRQAEGKINSGNIEATKLPNENWIMPISPAIKRMVLEHVPMPMKPTIKGKNSSTPCSQKSVSVREARSRETCIRLLRESCNKAKLFRI